MRPRVLRRRVAVAAAGIVLAGTGIGWGAGLAKADPPNCDTVLWGFLGSQRRTVCDGPLRADGSWQRARVIWTPAHEVPLSCFTSGGTYFSSTSCSGGYFVNETVNDTDKYPVTPDTVLPDEPGHLGGVLR